MTSSVITTEPRLRAGGPIRSTLPAAVAYSLEGPNTWPGAMPVTPVARALTSRCVTSCATRPSEVNHLSELVDVLEIEPQTTWIETDSDAEPYLVRDDVLAHLAALPGRKLVHSVGTPVGGSVRANAAQLPLLRETVRVLGSPWASEHLSFNLTADFFTGFFLPPRQTQAGIEIYVDAIRTLREELGVPIAIETGVNYLSPRADEIGDGEFIALVAERADCGILLDLHNVYCNALNGRQSVEEFLSALPLERVWELHLAGGFEVEGYWVDAHSGAIPQPLHEICVDVIPPLPQLKAIVFELFSSYLPHFGLDATRAQLERLHELWALRRPCATPAQRTDVPPTSRTAAAHATTVAPREWEAALGSVVIGREPSSDLELPMLQALADGVLLEELGEPGEHEIEIREDEPIRVRRADVQDPDSRQSTQIQAWS